MTSQASDAADLTASGSLDQKKAVVTDKLSKREDDRVADINKKKEERDNAAAENESSNFFKENYNKARREIEETLDKSETIPKSKMTEHFDNLVLSLQKLQSFVADSAMFMVPYEIQKAYETNNKMYNAITEKREALIPKKKFAFKSKKKTMTEKPTEKEPKEQKADINVQITECNFSDLSGETLVKSSDEIYQKDVALARLTRCVVKLQGSPSAIHVNGLRDCQIFSGPVSGSVFMDDCKNCTFVLPCQQLRVHHTTDTKFYLHVTSRAIIEDSTRLQFAPYNWSYEGIDGHYELSGLDKSRNTWDDVDDFNWLASDAKSPNWSVLDEKDRQIKWNL